MEALGLRGLAVVVDLLDAIALGSGGIHIVVTDRPAAVRAEIEARCPEGWVLEPLLSPERERLSTEAYAPPLEHGGRLLLAVVEPHDSGERSAMRALNDDREWMLRRATCAVVIVAGKDASDADAACLRLQGLAPDFWSVRNRVHHVSGPDEPRGVIDELLDRLSPKFHGDRAAARRWLDGRSVVEDWVAFRLWRDGRLRAAWLDDAEETGRGGVEPLGEGAFLEMRGSTQREVLDRSPIGEAIAPERWPQPKWRSGQLVPWQRELVSELQTALRREALGVLWILPGEPDEGAFEEVLLALGLLESRYEIVIHLDARGGLGPAIARLLREAGQDVEVGSEGVIHGCRCLQGALGGANALLLVHEVGPLELALLRGFTHGRAIVATVRAEPVATFCVAASEGRQAYAQWAGEELSAWAGGVVVQAIREQTPQLDLRAALGRGRFVFVVVDSTASDTMPRSVWELLAENQFRTGVLSVGTGSLALDLTGGRHVELGADEAIARERLWRLAGELAGEPGVRIVSEKRSAWPGALEGNPSSQASEHTLDEEQQRWLAWLGVHGPDSRQWGLECFERVAAALVLIGPVGVQSLREIATAVEPMLPEDLRNVVTECLTELHASPDGSLVLPIEPEVVAEELLVRVLEREARVEGGLARWLRLPLAEGMPAGAVGRALGVLTRLAEQRRSARRWTEQLLRDHGVHIVERAERTANEGRADPPGHVLAAAVRLLEDGEVAERLGDAVPGATVELREAAATAYQLALHVERGKLDPDASRMARLLGNVGRTQSNVGRREEALRATQEAVDIRRGLAEQRPDAFLPGLAMSLNNLGADLGALGLREEALRATQEAVDTYRGLAEQRPDVFVPDLAMSLNNLGNRLSDVGRREEALRATQEAVDAYRGLAEQRPDAFVPDLAGALNNLSGMQSNVGRREEALRTTQEAVDAYRGLAEQRPDAFVPDLAGALNNLGMMQSNVGRREEALRATQEAVDIRRGLAEQRPDAFLPNLAMSLNNLGVDFVALGRREEALRATQEAVDAYRGLAEQRPDVFLPDLAMSLHNLGMMQSAMGRREEALRATQEAVDAYRGLAEQRPDVFLPDLARSLGVLGFVHAEDGDHQRALEDLVEAARLIRPAFDRLPDAFRDQAVVTLQLLRRTARIASLPIPDDLSPWMAQVLDSSPESDPDDAHPPQQ